MIALDIPLLNLKSPYYVVQDADGDLLFETDYGVKYGISFELNEGMMNYPAYEFGILNKNGQPSPNDRKLRDTILAIIEEFFRANGGVLLYICATGDGMQKYRFHLFLRWFNTYEHRDLYEIRTVEDVMDDVRYKIAGKSTKYLAISQKKLLKNMQRKFGCFGSFRHFVVSGT